MIPRVARNAIGGVIDAAWAGAGLAVLGATLAAGAAVSAVETAATTYALPARTQSDPVDQVRELEKAGALIAAEIDRLLRAAARGGL